MISYEEILPLISFRTSRSSGPGGQAVNKLETRVEAILNIDSLTWLSDLEKEKLNDKLGNRITAGGELIVACSETRSQKRNKEIAVKRLINLLTDATKEQVPRKKTKPSRAGVRKRLDSKSKLSEVKQRRRWKPD